MENMYMGAHAHTHPCVGPRHMREYSRANQTPGPRGPGPGRRTAVLAYTLAALCTLPFHIWEKKNWLIRYLKLKIRFIALKRNTWPVCTLDLRNQSSTVNSNVKIISFLCEVIYELCLIYQFFVDFVWFWNSLLIYIIIAWTPKL